MTNCTATKIEFPALKRRKIEAQFSGGAIISDGGVLLLRSIDQRLKLTEQVAAQITDPRDPDKIRHQVVDLLRQRVYELACGYEDLNDHDTLRNDIAMQTAVEKDQDLGSRSNLMCHESTTTTHRYVEADLAMKEKALARLQEPETILCRYQPADMN